MPTVVIEARDAQGKETSTVRVTVDGVPFTERADGRSLPLNPGEHVVLYEMDGKSIEEKVVVREGEKHRKLQADFSKIESAQAPKPVSSSPTPAPTSETASDSGSSSIPVATYIFGGLGIAGLGSFATFGLLGRSKQNELETNCKPACEQSEVDSMHRRFLIADVSLGVAVASLGVATVLFLTRPKPAAPASPASARVGVMPSSTGLQFSFQSTF